MAGREHTQHPNWRSGCCRGPPWPLLPGVTDMHLEQNRWEAFPCSYSRVTSAALVLLGEGLVLHRWWDLEGGGSPSCFSPEHVSLAFNLGHRYFKRLIKMPGPQGPLTHTSTFVCIMRAEQLLDAGIRDNVLRTKVYK